MPLHTPEELINLSRSEKQANKRIRLLAIAKFLVVNNRAQVARELNVSRRSVNDWVSAYLSAGIKGLDDKPRLGKASRLTAAQNKDISEYINNAALSEDGGRLTGEKVRD